MNWYFNKKKDAIVIFTWVTKWMDANDDKESATTKTNQICKFIFLFFA